LKKNFDGVSFERYKLAKKEAKIDAQNAKVKVYKEVYEKLDTKEVENDIYRIARIRKRKTRHLCTVRCVKDEDQKVLVRDEEIKERWREYFDKLFNSSSIQDLDDLTIQCKDMNHNYMRRISESKVKEVLKRMKSRKAVGPDGIPIEVRKCLGEVGVRWLTNLFNKIWLTKKMPNEWRKSTLVPLYKNKSDIQSCSNYRRIKFMCHTMKLWERVIEHKLRQNVTISENQFGFMPGRLMTEAIHLLR